MKRFLKLNKLFLAVWLVFVNSVAIHATESEMSLENANWETFTNRQWISALALSESKSTLWVATDGGLEKRDTQNKLIRTFIKSSGLPENSIEVLLEDTTGGLWVGTSTNGLAYLAISGQWTVFNTKNSGLLSDAVEALLSDGQGGLLVGTMGGLAHYQSDSKWTTVFGRGNLELPDIWVKSLLSDSQGGLWVGTQGGYLFHRDHNNQWSVFSSELPPNGGIQTLLNDGQGGIWIGTAMIRQEGQFIGGGLVHREANGNWSIFNSDIQDYPIIG
jgi:ligand-binding sensor domain-containing protein